MYLETNKTVDEVILMMIYAAGTKELAESSKEDKTKIILRKEYHTDNPFFSKDTLEVSILVDSTDIHRFLNEDLSFKELPSDYNLAELFFNLSARTKVKNWNKINHDDPIKATALCSILVNDMVIAVSCHPVVFILTAGLTLEEAV